eukprot:1689847-Amphidinium_carterae.1
MLLSAPPRGFGIHHDLHEALGKVSVAISHGVMIGNRSGSRLSIVDLRDKPDWPHKLRQLLRLEASQEVATRRPREFEHIKKGVHGASWYLWRHTRDKEVISALKRWHSGCLPYRDRQYRHAKVKTVSRHCPWCYHNREVKIPETLDHVVQHCPRWNAERGRSLEELLPGVNLPSQVWHSGLLPAGLQLDDEQKRTFSTWQGRIARLIRARERELHTFEEQHGMIPLEEAEIPPEPPVHIAQHRLARQDIIAEEGADGRYAFMGHEVCVLRREHPAGAMLLCRLCRRSAAVEDDLQQGLAVIRRKGPCKPSSLVKIDGKVKPFLPEPDIEILAIAGGKRARCRKCNGVAAAKEVGRAFGPTHALCIFLATSETHTVAACIRQFSISDAVCCSSSIR